MYIPKEFFWFLTSWCGWVTDVLKRSLLGTQDGPLGTTAGTHMLEAGDSRAPTNIMTFYSYHVKFKGIICFEDISKNEIVGLRHLQIYLFC